MFNVYPYSAANAVIHQIDANTQANKSGRINSNNHRQDNATMQSHLHMLEAHVQAVSTKRLQEALLAEQLRLARGNQPAGISKVISNLRSTTGLLLITLGERLHKQPAAITRTAQG